VAAGDAAGRTACEKHVAERARTKSTTDLKLIWISKHKADKKEKRFQNLGPLKV